MIEPVLLTPIQAARALGIGRSTLYELMRTGSIQSIKIGGCRRIPTAALHDFVAAATEERRLPA